MYSSYLTVVESLHRTVVSFEEQLFIHVMTMSLSFQREKNVIRLLSVEGGFHHSGFQAEWIEIFNNFNKNSQHLLDTGIQLLMFSIQLSKLHRLSDVQPLNVQRSRLYQECQVTNTAATASRRFHHV